MKVTSSMRRCLALVRENGEAVRVWYGTGQHEWSWRVNGTPVSYPVDRCIRAGLVEVEGRDRAVLSPLGRRVLASA